MVGLDYAVIVAYLLGIVLLGALASRARSLTSVSDFFLGGRRFRWWVVGTSMVATTFAADTPLTVAGLTINDGVAGNWFWWSMAISHVLVAVVLARLWRRAGVVTDAEFCELRYQGGPATLLRALKAFYFAVPINCIVMGWVFLAMLKVSGAVLPEVDPWTVVLVLLCMTLVYSVRSGFHGVVLTDLVQFPIALGGAIVLAWYALDAAGGLEAVVDGAVAAKGEVLIDLFPVGGELLPWESLAAFLGVQWWAQKYADGGGIFIQRMLSAKTEQDAELGGLWFVVAHYVLRPWPWLLAGMAAIVLLPEAVALDAEAAYAQLIVEVLPAGLRGLLVASFLAAFMSTMDTHMNWGASYVVNDLVGPRMELSPQRVRLVSRLCVLAIAALALVATAMMDTIAGAWEFLTAFGAGAGAVMLLRWYWWRVNAAAEIGAMVASTVLSSAVYLLAPDLSYLAKLGVIVVGSAAVWVPCAMLGSRDPAALVPFYEKVRPPGPGWASVARAAGMPQPAPLGPDLVRWLFALACVMACLLGTGQALLGAPSYGVPLAILGAIGIGLLGRSRARVTSALHEGAAGL